MIRKNSTHFFLIGAFPYENTFGLSCPTKLFMDHFADDSWRRRPAGSFFSESRRNGPGGVVACRGHALGNAVWKVTHSEHLIAVNAGLAEDCPCRFDSCLSHALTF